MQDPVEHVGSCGLGCCVEIDRDSAGTETRLLQLDERVTSPDDPCQIYTCTVSGSLTAFGGKSNAWTSLCTVLRALADESRMCQQPVFRRVSSHPVSRELLWAVWYVAPVCSYLSCGVCILEQYCFDIQEAKFHVIVSCIKRIARVWLTCLLCLCLCLSTSPYCWHMYTYSWWENRGRVWLYCLEWLGPLQCIVWSRTAGESQASQQHRGLIRFFELQWKPDRAAAM